MIRKQKQLNILGMKVSHGKKLKYLKHHSKLQVSRLSPPTWNRNLLFMDIEDKNLNPNK